MSSLAEQIAEKFDLIDPSNDADMAAIGMAIIGIPSDTGSTEPTRYEFMRQEVVYALCLPEAKKGLNKERLEKLKTCLTLAEHAAPDAAEDNNSLWTFIEEVEATEPESKSVKSREEISSRTEHAPANTVTHAEDVIADLRSVQESFRLSYSDDIVSVDTDLVETGGGELIASLNKLGRDYADLYDQAFSRELKIAEEYLRVCRKLQEVEVNQVQLASSLEYAQSVHDGKPKDVNLIQSEHSWLTQISDSISALDAARLEKQKDYDMRLDAMLSSSRQELDTLQSELEALRQTTLASPADALRSLSQDDSDENSVHGALDFSDSLYEESLDVYMDWIQGQRVLIKDKSEKIKALGKTLAAKEAELKNECAASIQAIVDEIADQQQTVKSTIEIMSKDREDFADLLNSLQDDAGQIIDALQRSMRQRTLFASQFEDCLASATIQLGRVSDDGSNGGMISNNFGV
ncbi:hypothetical protein N9Q14_02850 [Pseudomonadales bacterium]|nr:hypothetical protein [Pseudomonadales bacterium]